MISEQEVKDIYTLITSKEWDEIDRIIKDFSEEQPELVRYLTEVSIRLTMNDIEIESFFFTAVMSWQILSSRYQLSAGDVETILKMNSIFIVELISMLSNDERDIRDILRELARKSREPFLIYLLGDLIYDPEDYLAQKLIHPRNASVAFAALFVCLEVLLVEAVPFSVN